MNETDIHVFIAEIRKDVSYIKERITERFTRYDSVCDQVQTMNTRIAKLESAQTVVWFLVSVVIIGGIVLGLWLKSTFK